MGTTAFGHRGGERQWDQFQEHPAELGQPREAAVSNQALLEDLGLRTESALGDQRLDPFLMLQDGRGVPDLGSSVDFMFDIAVDTVLSVARSSASEFVPNPTLALAVGGAQLLLTVLAAGFGGMAAGALSGLTITDPLRRELVKSSMKKLFTEGLTAGAPSVDLGSASGLEAAFFECTTGALRRQQHAAQGNANMLSLEMSAEETETVARAVRAQQAHIRTFVRSQTVAGWLQVLRKATCGLDSEGHADLSRVPKAHQTLFERATKPPVPGVLRIRLTDQAPADGFPELDARLSGTNPDFIDNHMLALTPAELSLPLYLFGKPYSEQQVFGTAWFEALANEEGAAQFADTSGVALRWFQGFATGENVSPPAYPGDPRDTSRAEEGLKKLVSLIRNTPLGHLGVSHA